MPQTDLFWSYRYEEGFYNSEVQTPQRQPLRTFLPTGYEPNYPYPLIVFFHGHGSSEEQVLRLAPKLSRRNYICISLRGTQQLDPTAEGRPGYSWGQAGDLDPQIEDYVCSAITQTRRNYHVHSERIYLAGVCEGAALAYRLGLMYPERVAGIIALNGAMPRHGNPLLRLPEARQLRVLIGHGLANSVVPLSMAKSDFRLLYSAGLQVKMHSYPATHRLHTDMLRDINRWVMAAIHEEQHGPEEPEEEE